MVVERLPAENEPPCIYTGHLCNIVNLCTYPGYSVFVHSKTKHVKKKRFFLMSKWGHSPKKVGNHWSKRWCFVGPLGGVSD